MNLQQQKQQRLQRQRFNGGVKVGATLLTWDFDEADPEGEKSPIKAKVRTVYELYQPEIGDSMLSANAKEADNLGYSVVASYQIFMVQEKANSRSTVADCWGKN